MAIGKARWETVHGEKFGDISPPACFAGLFSIFIDLWYFAGSDGLTYLDIQAYMATTKTELSVYEVALIRKMASWAEGEINKALKESK